MKIRRKLPKPPRSGRPLYVVGYTANIPSPSEIQSWFDLEYGGPITFTNGDRSALEAETSPLLATHGPWSAWLQLGVPAREADEWKNRLTWRHDQAGVILGSSLTPRQASDSILHAARLARALTLLTEGTSYDMVSQVYRNPADWTDRSLERFQILDHVAVLQSEAADPTLEWFYTRGLAKFGLDELETFRPLGLPSRDVIDTLRDIADEVLRLGHSPTVGQTLSLTGLGLSLHVKRHRTAFPTESPLPVREITWSPINHESE